MLDKEHKFSLWVLVLYAQTNAMEIVDAYKVFENYNLFQLVVDGFEIFHTTSPDVILRNIEENIEKGGYKDERKVQGSFQ